MTTGSPPRAVFDCNVLIQAVSNSLGPAGQCLRLVEQSRVELFVSRAVLRELRAVLEYPTVRQKLPQLDAQRIEAFIQRLVYRATMVRDVRHIFTYPRAPQDEPYIDLALAAHADYLVSRDRDLLDLMTDHSLTGKEFRQRSPGLSIVTPVGFLERVESPRE
ncbi:MAG TPA: putative toxin-antitoxin system toxin component, PIN family [Tepidisphaeraceae bacterium]|jgi:putative PIN family toxin of toxin-antitoxin system|nr:putative toxin-antitoxin system toxin component, PIN family [Tepidisphaeraceae bacterium]